ncbi:MAG: DUF4412 domain-containing protein [Candidatus Eisenbacteria bacterium]
MNLPARVSLILAICAAVFVSAAVADTRILQRVHVDAMNIMGQSQPARDDTVTIWMAKDRMAVQGGGTNMILRLDLSQVYLLDHDEKSYSVLDLPIDFSKILPADDPNAAQFNQMLQMMASTTTVTPTEEHRTIGPWETRRYNMETKNQFMTILGTLWAGKDAHVDMEMYRSLSESMLSLNPALKDAMTSMKKIEGVIILQEQAITVMGQTTNTLTEILEIKEADAPGEAFRVPKDYSKKEFNPMEAMGRG